MASNPAGKCCTEGFKYEGEAAGSLKTIGGYEAYVTGPETSDKVVLQITDVFGHSFINNQLLADEFGKAGYKVIVPDLFNNDPAPPNPGSDFDLKRDWFPKHGFDTARVVTDKVLEAIKAELKPKFIAATGYCYGAKLAVQYSGEKAVDAIGCAHPSFVTIDEVKAIKTPIILAAAETDSIYTDDLRLESEKILKEIGATYFLTRASGVSHGFAVRGDPNDKMQAFARKKACQDFIQWFDFCSTQ
ncbi:hypothetical protein TRICI_000603 [Trichomonascus ciferrii]|uniref:Dienelactone hydrolase domain-containing protein n=1 Tax=Trichomonascus ciferrii TaxID=44093 RepID=A0A642VD12_9ASCO|nr:hypothetical protein TRICI_000603 [Trichomonascus ciferrii]